MSELPARFDELRELMSELTDGEPDASAWDRLGRIVGFVGRDPGGRCLGIGPGLQGHGA